MAKKEENFSILDKGLTLEGNLSFTGKMIIKGSVKGTVEGETVVIGEEGSVYADMKASSVTIGGMFEGKVRALKEMVVLSTGNCNGEVVCKDLVVEPGGVLNAKVTSLSLHGENEREFIEYIPKTGGKKGAAEPPQKDEAKKKGAAEPPRKADGGKK